MAKKAELTEADRKAKGQIARQKAILKKDPDVVSDAINAVFRWRGQPIVKSDQEVAERLTFFFQSCADTGEMPTVEKLALALGTYGERVRKWERGADMLPGMTESTSDMIRKAKQMIQATDAELVIKGAMGATQYIFRAKNYYGMTDNVEPVVAAKDKTQSKEQLEKRYSEVVDVEYREKQAEKK